MTRPASAPLLRTPRTLSREERRIQLLEATLETISECGLSRTTLTAVARRAGLSHGLVLFYFESKERLLVETLGYLSDEYQANWRAALASSGPAPEQQLMALVEADFSPQVCQPSRVNAWSAYWSEAQSRPLYMSKCGENDALYARTMEAVCTALNAAHGYTAPPIRAARLIRLAIDGTWLEMMTLIEPYDQAEAKRTVWTLVSLLYPRHFGAEGPFAAAG
ncbi:MAG: TetR family transcriptional regulator C-terminal domain-containing protein [Aestuariivirga sp.]|uniref:TetR family transcriptional regulator n=1 Tax=Aestuariivirga sp. TaxID=2650926 RepID=UPI0025C2DA8E|nr:TetR family transcriptional regulator [Aestuariivirga sp.]MCA3562133.1 TetR family transcriptional regulator C-terminal domain-containing protein [Aestuariivirga sp.]